MIRRRVVLESPLAGKGSPTALASSAELLKRNKAYARAALRDSLLRGEAPFASHLLYAQEGVLDDTDPVERSIGIEAGLDWGSSAEATVVYVDLGISIGMIAGMDRARADGRPVEYRSLEEWKDRD